MLKCPFCGFVNEDGALFCEQCKSDLSTVSPAPTPAPAPAPMAEPMPVAEILSADDIVEVIDPIPSAEPIPAAVAVPDLPPPFEHATAAVVEAFEPVPGPLPAMAPPLENEVAAAEEALAHAAPVAVPAPAPTPTPAPAPAGGQTSVPAGAAPKLVVRRGQKVGEEYPIYGDTNFIGRSDEKPVDIDLEHQEPPDRVYSSRQHAVIHFDDAAGVITIEDLNSANGTYVNRERVYPGQKRQLFVNDTVQIGTVHMTLKV